MSARLATLPGTVGALVTREVDGAVATLLERNADTAAPLGSAFKLYVLAAVADEVAAGDLAWDEMLVLTTMNRSLPSGMLQAKPDGTEISVLQAARQMIGISDNTATDLLIERVGRERVERAVTDLGHSDPAAMTPFLTTREMFQLSYGAGEGNATARELQQLSSAWGGADVAERRRILQRVDELPFALSQQGFVDRVGEAQTPPWTRGLEWFATPADLAAAHRGLAARAERQPELKQVFLANPGFGASPGLDREVWPSIAYKGGGNVGVVTGAWRAVAADGSAVSVVLMVSGDTAETAQQIQPFGGEISGLSWGILEILGRGAAG